MREPIIFENLLFTHPENPIIQFKPSQIRYIDLYLLFLILLLAIIIAHYYYQTPYIIYLTPIPIFLALRKILQVYTTIFILSNQRITKKQGILTRKTFDLELYRVKKIELTEPLLMRIFKLGDIKLTTAQPYQNFFNIPGVKKSQLLRNKIRNLVEGRRLKTGTRELDVN